ncbi:hypothetical protein [Christensenella minuta]|uniref:hypothetical protein n=1 Tax=Christensenella minuta TaxID=626937 RepID=UPI0021575732|nr:hypothetical protein [Christensenella minuta]
MKKIVSLCLMVFLCLTWVLVGCSNDEAKQSESATENTPIVTTSEAPTPTPVPTVQNDKWDNLVVTVVDKVLHEANMDTYQLSDFVEFVINVQNDYDKEIRGVEGILTISDMFGKEIMSANLDITEESIPAGGSIQINDKGLDVNQFMDSHAKIRDTPFEDLIFTYEPTHILFTDGTSLE